MRFLLSLFLLFQLCLFGGSDLSDFDGYQERWTRPEIEKKLEQFLQRDERMQNFFTLTDEVFTLYDTPISQKERSVEFCLKLIPSSKKEEGSTAKRKNLVGCKIAIDPGHLGGKYARLEERFIDIPPSLEREKAIAFDEGTLSFLTARYLQILLEKEGAEVMITRKRIGEGVYEKDFFDWLKASPELWWKEAHLTTLFRRYYNPLDLRARAKRINAYAPDLTVVIHYNSQEVAEGSASNHSVASSNYNMVFIPGAFCRSELITQESRYEFIRLLVTDDLPASLHLSQAILKQFSSHLGVPVVSKNDGARYLENVCLKLDEGVYARNLALTRLVHGPVCYGETLIQNNIDECQTLSRKDFVIDGRRCSSRIKQVAEAYFDGIKEHLLN
ncbi:MAG: hypothetical protein KR126chlam1_00156 [Chlamydiae bacterium]|nr:hypothetical protein [Chlamydiota bacterium]